MTSLLNDHCLLLLYLGHRGIHLLEEGLEDLKEFLRLFSHIVILFKAEVVAHESMLLLYFLQLSLQPDDLPVYNSHFRLQLIHEGIAFFSTVQHLLKGSLSLVN